MLENGMVVGAAEEWERQNNETVVDYVESRVREMMGSDRVMIDYINDNGLLLDVIDDALGVTIPKEMQEMACNLVRDAIETDNPLAMEMCRDWLDTNVDYRDHLANVALKEWQEIHRDNFGYIARIVGEIAR